METLEEGATEIIKTLRRIADAVERELQRPLSQDGAYLAEHIQHTVLWGVANMGLDTLTRKAARFDADKES